MRSLQAKAPAQTTNEGWDAQDLGGSTGMLGTRRPPALDSLLSAAGRLY